MKKILAIDFDGTIVENKYPEIGPLIKDAKETINKLYDSDKYYIIIWTCRADKDLRKAIKFLYDEEIKFHQINRDAPPEYVDFPIPDDYCQENKYYQKVYCHYMIDDRSISGLPKWEEIYNILRKKDE